MVQRGDKGNRRRNSSAWLPVRTRINSVSVTQESRSQSGSEWAVPMAGPTSAQWMGTAMRGKRLLCLQEIDNRLEFIEVLALVSESLLKNWD